MTSGSATGGRPTRKVEMLEEILSNLRLGKDGIYSYEFKTTEQDDEIKLRESVASRDYQNYLEELIAICLLVCPSFLGWQDNNLSIRLRLVLDKSPKLLANNGMNTDLKKLKNAIGGSSHPVEYDRANNMKIGLLMQLKSYSVDRQKH